MDARSADPVDALRILARSGTYPKLSYDFFAVALV
jgi:hypothetical protein